MPNKTFHIPVDEIPLWDAAKRVARLQQTSLYRVVSEALQRDLPRAAAEGAPRAKAEEWSQIAADAV